MSVVSVVLYLYLYLYPHTPVSLSRARFANGGCRVQMCVWMERANH
jgi:hypothetical protein